MRIGAPLPSNVVRLEYDNYIYDNFDNLGVGVYRSDVMLIKKNAEHSIIDTRLRRYWEYGGGVVADGANGAKFPAYVDTNVFISTISNQTEGWWKFRVKIAGASCSPPFAIRFIYADTQNGIYIEIGTNNRVKLRKKVAGIPTTLIDTGTDLGNGTTNTIEVTRNESGDYEVWINSVSEGTDNDVWLPTIDSLYIINDSSVICYLLYIRVDAERPN